MKSTSSLSLLFAFVLSLTTTSAKSPPTPVTVAAPAGTIIGQTGRLNSTVHEFLGIPFAKPPTGALRFEPPVRKPPSNKTISARNFGLSCPGFYAPDVGTLISLDKFNVTAPVEGEDCLSVNIWKKPYLKNAPVLVWIYGGGFVLGTSNLILYDGTYFAAHNDVVVVSLNYRTNVFGFPNSPAVETENVGLLDQRMAVEWVRDNIAAFGGNPNQITIFGESAGAISVDIWSYAWAKDPIVKGFIEQSGTVNTVSDIGSGQTDPYYSWNNLTVAAGCASGTAKQELECMKSLDWEKVRNALYPTYNAVGKCKIKVFGDIPGFFGPRVDGKIIFSPDEYRKKGENGEFARLPLLVGNTDKELSPSVIKTPTDPSCPAITIPGIPVTLTPEIFAELASAKSFVCASRTQARYRALHHVPVWRYRFFDSLNFTTQALNLNASHGSELVVIFGLVALAERLQPREAEFLRLMQSAWTAFARNPSRGLSDRPFNWNRFTLNVMNENLVRLAYGQEWKPSMSRELPYDYWCDILEANGI